MKKYSYFNSLLIVLGLVLSTFGCQSENFNTKELPILGSREIVEKEIDGKTIIDTVYHSIPEFAFVDQDSSWVTEETMAGKIYVADFFFTTCPTICPLMKNQMMRVYDKYENNPEVVLLSHSIDPVYDSVRVLKDFASRLGVKSEKWHFVTGKKEDIYSIGEKSYMVTTQEDENEPGGYIHSGAFILVDKERRIRGFYDGTVREDVDELMKDMDILLTEYNTNQE
ncbi:MAG: SCO family protein [Cyclobacteriaceae bacterium]